MSGDDLYPFTDCRYSPYKSPKYSDIQARDITSISFEDTLLACNIDGSQLHLKRSDILKNFWQHRTRKPSYFSYKNLNSETAHVRNRDGQAIGKLSYKLGTTVLEILRSRIGSVATDEDGKKITYCIHPDNKTCTCSSWKEMNEHRDELEKNLHNSQTLNLNILFVNICLGIMQILHYL